jgi:hypothetical protein
MLQQHGAALDLLQKMSEKMREKTHEKARGKRAANQKVSRKGAPAVILAAVSSQPRRRCNHSNLSENIQKAQAITTDCARAYTRSPPASGPVPLLSSSSGR